MDITLYNQKTTPLTDPVKVQFRAGSGKLWKFGTPGSWELPAAVSQSETLQTLSAKDSKSNHWTIPVPDALVATKERFVDLLVYDNNELTAIALGGVLDAKTGHWYDPSSVPMDRVNRVPITLVPV